MRQPEQYQPPERKVASSSGLGIPQCGQGLRWLDIGGTGGWDLADQDQLVVVVGIAARSLNARLTVDAMEAPVCDPGYGLDLTRGDVLTEGA